MRWFVVFSLFFICFSTQSQVVCKDPNSVGGDEVAEAGSSSSLCRTHVTDAPQGPVDLGGDTPTATHIRNIAGVPAAAEEKSPENPGESPNRGGSLK